MPNFEQIETLRGSDYLAMRTGSPVAEGNIAAINEAAAVLFTRLPRADLTEYNIKVCREDDLLHVIFTDKERPEGMRGSGGRPGCPGFEVTLSADLAVVKAHFIK